MSKNPAAVALGKKSWAKRKKNPKHKEQLSAAGKAGAAKTNAIKAAKRHAQQALVDIRENMSPTIELE